MRDDEGIHRRTFMHNHGHGPKYGSWLGAGRGWGVCRWGKGEKAGTTVAA